MSGADFSELRKNLLVAELERAKSKEKELYDALKSAKKARVSWERLCEAHDEGWFARVLQILDDESEVFGLCIAKGDEGVRELQEFKRWSEEVARDNAQQFVSLFPKACTSAGMELDAESRHPKYSIRGFVKTEVDERRLIASITPRDGRRKDMPLDVDPIVKHLQDEVTRIFETKRDPKLLLADLRKAYRAVLRDEKKSPGDELPLRRVAKQCRLASRLTKERTRLNYDEFNVDLGNLVRSGETSIDNERLHLNHTRDIGQGMLLYGLESGGYVGFISFKLEEAS